MTDSQKTTRVGSRNEDSEAIVALSFLYIVCDDRSSNSKSRKLVVVVVGVDVDLGWRWVGGVVSGLGATSESGGENVRGWAAVKVPQWLGMCQRSKWRGCGSYASLLWHNNRTISLFVNDLAIKRYSRSKLGVFLPVSRFKCHINLSSPF